MRVRRAGIAAAVVVLVVLAFGKAIATRTLPTAAVESPAQGGAAPVSEAPTSTGMEAAPTESVISTPAVAPTTAIPTTSASTTAPAAAAPTTALRTPAPTPPTAAPAPPAGGLAVRVSGNRLVDGAGAGLILRGANMSGTEFVCAQGWSDDAYGGQPMAASSTMEAIKSWRANVLRVPLNEDCWLDINGVRVGGSAYQRAIHDEVKAAHASGLYVILDLHWSAPGSQTALSQNPLPDADHSPLFWRQVAESFKNDPGVIFDLFNEPYDFWGTGDKWDGWRNGGTQTRYVTGGQPYTITSNWKTAGMQQLVDAIRGTGATQPILVNGLDWGNDMSGWLAHVPTDPLRQIIAGAHIYSGQPCSSVSCWDKVYPAIAAAYPVLIGETGDSSAGPARFLPSFLAYADAHGWSYLAWTWNVWADEHNVLITTWTGEPNAGAGTVFRDHLLSVR